MIRPTLQIMFAVYLQTSSTTMSSQGRAHAFRICVSSQDCKNLLKPTSHHANRMRADTSGLRGGVSGEDIPRISDLDSGVKELLQEEESYR